MASGAREAESATSPMPPRGAATKHCSSIPVSTLQRSAGPIRHSSRFRGDAHACNLGTSSESRINGEGSRCSGGSDLLLDRVVETCVRMTNEFA